MVSASARVFRSSTTRSTNFLRRLVPFLEREAAAQVLEDGIHGSLSPMSCSTAELSSGAIEVDGQTDLATCAILKSLARSLTAPAPDRLQPALSSALRTAIGWKPVSRRWLMVCQREDSPPTCSTSAIVVNCGT